MTSVIDQALTENKDAIEVNYNKLVNEQFKDLFHDLHEVAWGICNPKWHDKPLKKPILRFIQSSIHYRDRNVFDGIR